MVQRRKRTQFTGKFKEHLEKVEGIIQEAIDNLPEIEVDGKLRKFFSSLINNKAFQMEWTHQMLRISRIKMLNQVRRLERRIVILWTGLCVKLWMN